MGRLTLAQPPILPRGGLVNPELYADPAAGAGVDGIRHQLCHHGLFWW